MPYIKLADRPMFDTMIDGLVSKIRGFDRDAMGQVAGSLVINALTPTLYSYGFGQSVDRIIKDLAKRIRVRGDANYCICRILLESMKPETGWSYHSLSDVVMACDAAWNLVYDVQREQKLEDAQVADAISVLGDVTTEIERRLLGPYEDKAILKNGDLACFANEDFALKPLSTPGWRDACGCAPCQCEPEGEAILSVPDLNMSGLVSDRPPCGRVCECDPECDPEGKSESKPIFDAFDLSVMKGDDPMPPLTEALTQAQWDAANLERRSNE